MKQVHPFSRASERGVTMIEMIIVLAVISAISLVTVPNFIAMYQSARVKATARGMITDVRNARQLAISSNTRTKVAYRTGPTVNEYEILRERRDRTTGASTWQRVKWGNLGPVVVIASSNIENAIADDDTPREVVFIPNGSIHEDSIPDGSTPYLELRTEEKVPKKTYRMEFTPAGNISLR